MALRLPQLLRTSPRLAFTCAVTAIVMLTSVAWSLHRKPKTWPPDEVPVAFWAWRNEAPSEADVRRAIQGTRARTLFLRAGQIDFQDGTLHRIRNAGGTLPQGIELHLVYNATRSLLAQLENVDDNLLASSIYEAFAKDAERGLADHATVAGLQIDIDVPTRLLPRYAKTLRAVHARLPPRIQLSITGLPTWMDSPALNGVLDQVDFWIPQFYGAKIPERMDQSIPISSMQFVAREVTRARELDRPFYAGLAAYSYALLYNNSGTLITLRGDMNPLHVSDDANLELMERGIINNTNEWRYVYRARAGGVIEGLAMNAGDFLVVDTPSTESLRLAARAVRGLAGKKLLGICVFRLPGGNDAATLRIEQIAAALGDLLPRVGVSAEMVLLAAAEQQRADVVHEARLTVVNTGTEGILTGDGLTVDLTVPPGSAQQLSLQGFKSVITHCGSVLNGSPVAAAPCSERRANVLRFTAASLAPGESVQARLVFNEPVPSVLFAHIEIQSDDGQTHVLNQQVIVSSGARK
ncbi:MAG TPA: DUF3142 domain-containing protein [Pyrinomonadaceae bacterium]